LKAIGATTDRACVSVLAQLEKVMKQAVNFAGAVGKGIAGVENAVENAIVDVGRRHGPVGMREHIESVDLNPKNQNLHPSLEVLSWRLNGEAGCFEWTVALIDAKLPKALFDVMEFKPGNCISLYNKTISSSCLHSWEIDARDIASGRKVVTECRSATGSFFGLSQEQFAASDPREFKFW
jgi:hypothetical protein